MHGPKGHTQLKIPECDVVICSGDIGGRTGRVELVEFLVWFEALPARKKIFIGGNHDLCLDEKRSHSLRNQGRNIDALMAKQEYEDCVKLIENYDVMYLCNRDYVWEGVKFYGSPYSPSFHRSHWAFNADRGEEIQKIWARIPSDTQVLITHSPPYRILDLVDERYKEREGEDMNVGCQDLSNVIKSRLLDLKLHCFGHIHDQYGVILGHVSNNRRVLFSNGAVLNNDYKQLVINPLTVII